MRIFAPLCAESAQKELQNAGMLLLAALPSRLSLERRFAN